MILFDDIRYTHGDKPGGMLRAWNTVKYSIDNGATFDMESKGLVVKGEGDNKDFVLNFCLPDVENSDIISRFIRALIL